MLISLLFAACSAPPRPRSRTKPAEDVSPAMALVPDGDNTPLAVVHSFPGIDLLESSASASHEHGGAAAKILSLPIMFEVNDRRTHEIETKRVELLRRHCMEKQWHSRQVVQLGGHFKYRDDMPPGGVPGTARVVIPSGEPQRYAVLIRFAAVDVYQACDVFGFSIDLVVDRVRHVFEIPFDVTRIEPLDTEHI